MKRCSCAVFSIPCSRSCLPADRRRLASRSGAVSAMILVVLIVLSGMVASQVKMILTESRQSRKELDYLQTEHLANAGILLADMQRQRDREWKGTVWEVPAGEIHQTNSARVTITVLQDNEIQVVAEYPSNAPAVNKVTRIRKLTYDTL